MTTAVDVKPLDELISEGFTKSQLRKALSQFRCDRDPDITFFLKAHAIQNEGTGASRTYLALSSDSLAEDRLEIVAFFTLAVTVTDYSRINEDDRLRLLGRVPGLSSTDFFPGYLIAQLARDDRYGHADFDASTLLVLAEDLIRDAVSIVGGRLIYLDCKPELLMYYEGHGFKPLYLNEKNGLYKLVKPIE